jgi:hypothetical protein
MDAARGGAGPVTFFMTVYRKAMVLLLLLSVLGVCFAILLPHWLVPHGRVTCAGQPVIGAGVYRSRRGDLFVYAPSMSLQVAMVSPKTRVLGRCNPAFTPLFGLLFSRDRAPDVQCTSMWKGGGSNDADPPHIVSDAYAEFPWGSCSNLRIDY